jgi:predicted dienelactone hydrolase
MDNFVGYCRAKLIDEHTGVTFPMAVMYPTSSHGKAEKLGHYNLDVSIDPAPQKGMFPLVLLSHGSGGSHLVYRTLAHHLALNGFIIGMPEHPFNNRNNNTLEGTVENLTNRPKLIRTVIDWFFNSSKFADFLTPDSVSIIGHSMGGYTALAVAGGVPTSLPNESSDRNSRQISVTPDSRVKALVLLAPASVWFRDDGALSKVNLPILMLFGEKDEYTPYGYHGQIILDGVPDKRKIQHRIVKNAGHFSFLSQFPESMINAGFAPSQDPLGFNRESFHHELNAEILDFLRRQT